MISSNLLIWIILTPLLGGIINGLGYIYNIKVEKVGKGFFKFVAIVTPILSFIFTFIIFIEISTLKVNINQNVFEWISLGNFTVNFELFADHLSIFMALFVTFVGSLIHIYATWYMKDDKGFGKFFAFFNMFLAAMLLLVLGDNLIMMFIGWEGVGLFSYLLISYYYQDKNNVIAGNKAFWVNRIGDLGFILGFITLFFGLGEGSLSFGSLEVYVDTVNSDTLKLSAILFFIGAMGKSAQIPLYIWLPDAMAGPTPVSALIHAATMVTAGIYMVARLHFLYDGFPEIGLFIAYIGTFSALLAGLIATRQNDIKKILAYSTMSQLGYMFIAVGLGFYATGLFHVFTHAFFKALLFMGAGAIIVIAHHEQDIFKIGTKNESSKFVQYTFLVATLALCAIFPTSGFFSKDMILAAAFNEHQYLIWGIGVFTAFLTSYYMFRLYFVVFNKSLKNDENLKNVSMPLSIIIPFGILSFGSIITAFVNLPHIFGGSEALSHWLSDLNSKPLHLSILTEITLMIFSSLVSLAGIYLAYYKFYKNPQPEEPKGLIYNKFYVDEIYQKIFITPLLNFSDFIAKIDISIIDKTIMYIASSNLRIGKKMAVLQDGIIRNYLLLMLLGISIMSIYLSFVLSGVK